MSKDAKLLNGNIEPDETRAQKSEEPSPKRPSFIQVIKDYRLLKYVRPYKKLLILMMTAIVLYSAGHFGRALVLRELLSEALWLPPEPEPINCSWRLLSAPMVPWYVNSQSPPVAVKLVPAVSQVPTW